MKKSEISDGMRVVIVANRITSGFRQTTAEAYGPDGGHYPFRSRSVVSGKVECPRYWVAEVVEDDTHFMVGYTSTPGVRVRIIGPGKHADSGGYYESVDFPGVAEDGTVCVERRLIVNTEEDAERLIEERMERERKAVESEDAAAVAAKELVARLERHGIDAYVETRKEFSRYTRSVRISDEGAARVADLLDEVSVVS